MTMRVLAFLLLSIASVLAQAPASSLDTEIRAIIDE